MASTHCNAISLWKLQTPKSLDVMRVFYLMNYQKEVESHECHIPSQKKGKSWRTLLRVVSCVLHTFTPIVLSVRHGVAYITLSSQ